jgi:geranylgeranyl reductase family protein
MLKTYQTIVIGAGPAGLNAARFLGEKSLILEKKQSIGLPVQCGEGISIDALKRENIAVSAEWIAEYIRHVKRIMPNGRYIGDRRKEPYAVVLKRNVFENDLANQTPWEIRLNTRVVGIEKENGRFLIQTDKGERFSSTYVIGADGPNSLVARQVFGLNPSLVPAANYAADFEKPLPDDELHMYFGHAIAPFGYGWVFPTSTRSANIGLLIKHKGRVRDYFQAFLKTVVKPAFGNVALKENKSGVLPVCGFYKSVVKENAFLTGDAGAFTDPIFEGGINMALLTGRLAAQSINSNNPMEYQNHISQLPFTGQDLAHAQKLFYGLDDETLNDLGDVLHANGTSYLATKQGQSAFASKPNLVKNQDAIAKFAQIWQSAKPYIW